MGFFLVEPSPVIDLVAESNSSCVIVSWSHTKVNRDKVYQVQFKAAGEGDWKVNMGVGDWNVNILLLFKCSFITSATQKTPKVLIDMLLKRLC